MRVQNRPHRKREKTASGAVRRKAAAMTVSSGAPYGARPGILLAGLVCVFNAGHEYGYDAGVEAVSKPQ
jgi:hypothetical protein